MAQVITKQEKQKKDDDMRRTKAGITDRDQEEMVIAGEMRNCMEWWWRVKGAGEYLPEMVP